MKIIIDKNIPFVRGVFESYASVDYMAGAAIGPLQVDNADALMIRTRTRCDETLLRDSSVGIIATATIGYDHIDLDYCRRRAIRVATSSGCNAAGVAQWVFAAILALGIDPGARRVLGVVGVGNVGGIVARVARSVGFEVLECDPVRQRTEHGLDHFVSYEDLLRRSDIITFHTPLDSTTRGMFCARAMSELRQDAVVLNSSRGEIIEPEALIKARECGLLARVALDVWPGEPMIDRRLLQSVDIATPHIAGYSLQGKALGSAMAVRAVARHLGIENLLDWYPEQVTPVDRRFDISLDQMVCQMPRHYDIMADDAALRHSVSSFEVLREAYHYRTEFF